MVDTDVALCYNYSIGQHSKREHTMFDFVKPAEAFARPRLEEFYDEEFGYDYYAYDMAVDQWQSQFPNLSERWCGEQKCNTEPTQSLEDILNAALFELAA